uniref:Uncharacterized protein n=1 Tax=Photinus pyralis TaxID=7054 RepID=A0A1Y1LUP1_PHOPY
MGVTGLWRLIEPSGQPVPLQTLDNKVLAVDVSIWLHQAIKGFQNAQGGTLPNAHLLGIYHRICKLLFFGIKPVVIFDGGVPSLKQETIYKRANKRAKNLNEADTIHKQLVSALLKHTAINKILSEESKINLVINSAKEKGEDLYKLPPTDFESTVSEEESTTSVDSSPTKHWDLHTIDEKSVHFKALPADVRHDILTDLKETRKQSSWGRLHELPKKSDDFSGFQMKRLLKRYSVQVSLEEAEKEMGGRSLSLAELETLLNDQGVITGDSVGKHIASDESKKYLLIKDLKKAINDAKRNAEVTTLENVPKEEQTKEESTKENPTKADKEFEEDLELAIQLSLQDTPSTSQETSSSSQKGCKQKQRKRNNFSFLQDFDDADFPSSSESEEDCSKPSNANKVLDSVKNYMVEYSGLTPNEVAKIMSGEVTANKSEKPKSALNDDAVIVQNSKLPSVTIEVDEHITIEDNGSSDSPEELVEDEHAKETPKGDMTHSFEIVSKSVEDVPQESASAKLPSTTVEVEEGPVDGKAAEFAYDVSSDSAEEFVEVEETPKEDTKNLFEIVIQPEKSVEDDLFSDVFSSNEVSANKNLPGKVNLKKLTAPLPVESEGDRNQGANEATTNQVQDDHTVQNRVTSEELREIRQDLEDQNIELLTDQLTKERMANSLSEQIVQETQDLLRLFGVPYIVAPMEAEAQCAFLEIINLTDGTITDDSDIWLFGGKTVYKNFFNQQKHVMEFRAERIQEHYKLTREQMILLALLVGSDYTIGIQGIGPVTALEILGAFPPPKKLLENSYNYQQLAAGLEEFRKWLCKEKVGGLGRTGLRTKLKNVAINEGFPNLNVIRAYLEPNIDSSGEAFSWGKPNERALVEYAKRKFGWPPEKSENILKPVLKKQNETQSQKSIKDYFKTKHKITGGDIENKMSKRVKRAVDTIENGDKEEKKKRQKRKQRKTPEENDHLSSDEDVQALRKSKAQTRTKVKQIRDDIEKQVAVAKPPRAVTKAQLHKKEVIPQKQRDKADALRSKIKAIEVFRKSRKGPGYVEPRKMKKRAAKEDAELSESSSD